MILKILGSLDILSGIVFWMSGLFHFIPQKIMIIFAFYLLIKGVVFLISKDIASILDVCCSLIIFLSFSYSIPAVIVIIIALFLIQKGILSWIA